MSVSKAGPRLYRSIPFRHLGKGGAAGSKRSSNISMNLTPFVDMMTILVTFLLMVFSASGELLRATKGLELPAADRKDILQIAPVISISDEKIEFQGEQVATIDLILKDENPQLKIEKLFEKMQAYSKKRQTEINVPTTDSDKLAKKICDEAKQGKVNKENLCPLGLAILQADKDTDARIINMVVTTAKFAEFDNLLFAVKAK
jgi:biopolymer transport protein ExbD